MTNKKRNLKQILLLSLACVALMQSPGFAFAYQIETLDKPAITKLSDDKLLDSYIDVLVELEAGKTFHQTSGFRDMKEYDQFKTLIRYKFDLLLEIQKRKLEVPKIGG